MRAKADMRAIRVQIAGEVLESVFEECDRYDRDETGGRVVGHFSEDFGTLVVQARGVIEPGPNARRTRSSFFQDGEHQTEVFRRLEAKDPSLEHLGNWHTHHVNGFPTLSSGDVATYRRIVNHHLHNLDFFYALLVTKKHAGRTGLDRYEVRHYVLFRGEDDIHEVRKEDVEVTDEARIWPKEGDVGEDDWAGRVTAVRARDRRDLEKMWPSMEPRLSSRTGTFFWKGPLPLIDGSAINVMVAEVMDEEGLYRLAVPDAPSGVAALCETAYPSASRALHALESRMNWNICTDLPFPTSLMLCLRCVKRRFQWIWSWRR